MSRIRRASVCHPGKQHWAHGLCQLCYLESRRRGSGILPKAPKDTNAPTCHPDKSPHIGGLCKTCYEKTRIEKSNTRADCHPDRKVKARGLCYPCYRRQPDIELKNYYGNIKREYGVTPENYDFLLEKCNGVCSTCFGPFEDGMRKRPCIDHNHKTGEIRGLLCSKCNTGIGQFNDDIELIKRVVEYMNSPSPLKIHG